MLGEINVSNNVKKHFQNINFHHHCKNWTTMAKKERTGIKIYFFIQIIASSREKLFIYQKQKMHQRQKPESFGPLK